MYTLGIDPGNYGGAVLMKSKNSSVETLDDIQLIKAINLTPELNRNEKLPELIQSLLDEAKEEVYIVIEKLNSPPHLGPQRAFQMGRNYERILCLTNFHFRKLFLLTHPRQWKRSIPEEYKKIKDTKDQVKEFLKAYPHIYNFMIADRGKVYNNGKGDAAVIAYHGMKFLQNKDTNEVE